MTFSWLVVFISIAAWSWFNQQGLAGAMLSFFIALALFAPWRWDLKPQQFHRIGDLASVLVVLLLLYGVFAQTEQKTVFIILQWLPFCFAPVLFAQLLGAQARVPSGILFYSVRRRPLERMMWLDFRMPFAGIAVLSAGAGNDQSGAYFIIVVVILLLMLWRARPRRDTVFLWLLVMTFSTLVAYQGQLELRALHGVIEEKAVDWFSDWQADPFKGGTSIGDIGELKLSDTIEYRIQATEPLLLQQTSYDRYMGQSWYASKRRFNSLDWKPEQKQAPLKQMTISQLGKRESILALPAGAQKIEGLEGAVLESSELGAIKLSEAPDFVSFKVYYSGMQSGNVGRYDLDVPEQHQAWIALLKQTLKLENQPDDVIAENIVRYFHRHYYYTLFLGATENADHALREFILDRKAGHCEYFAVASVFLLRSYGIPARLANGYAMQEYDETEREYIVRRRHAHAWAIAYIDSQWRPVDATPSQWLSIEEQNANPLQSLSDWFTSLQFSYRQWRYLQAQSEQEDGTMIWGGIVLLLLIYLLWRLYAARRQLVSRERPCYTSEPGHDLLGQDIEFYLIEQALRNTEQARLNNEPVAAWVKRINNQDLIAFVQIYYRYRFDPQGLSPAKIGELKRDIRRWLAGLNSRG